MPENPPNPAKDAAPPNFEQAMAALATIVNELEDGQIGLDQSLCRYEEGVKLLRHCHALLQAAERKIELLTQVDATGQATTEPFDDAPTAGEAGAGSATRSRRRSAKPSKPGSEGSAGSSEIDESGGLF